MRIPYPPISVLGIVMGFPKKNHIHELDVFLHVEFCWIVVVLCLIVDPNLGFGTNSLITLYLIVRGDNLII